MSHLLRGALVPLLFFLCSSVCAGTDTLSYTHNQMHGQSCILGGSWQWGQGAVQVCDSGIGIHHFLRLGTPLCANWAWIGEASVFGGVVGYSHSGFVCTRLPYGFQSVTNIQTRTWDVPFKTDCCFKKKKRQRS